MCQTIQHISPIRGIVAMEHFSPSATSSGKRFFLTIAGLAMPMTWWVRAIYFIIMAALFIRLTLRGELFHQFRGVSRTSLAVIGAAVILAFGFNSAVDDYKWAALTDRLEAMAPASPSVVQDRSPSLSFAACLGIGRSAISHVIAERDGDVLSQIQSEKDKTRDEIDWAFYFASRHQAVLIYEC